MTPIQIPMCAMTACGSEQVGAADALVGGDDPALGAAGEIERDDRRNDRSGDESGRIAA